jgi:hypothetical protein
MARHCGHHRYRLPLRIRFRTSTGERRHSRHGTATSSGLSIRVSLCSTDPVRRTRPSRSHRRTNMTVGWSHPPEPWLEQTTRRYGRVCDYVRLRISERRREIDSPNGFALWTPQKSPFAANHEDFHRRAAAGWTRHGNQLGTVQPRIHGSQKNDLLGQGATEQVVVHTYGGVERDAPASIGAPARRDDVAPAVPAC